ncbi:MAG: hypothetical protein AB1700_16730, partial [Bacillota bacterium]
VICMIGSPPAAFTWTAAAMEQRRTMAVWLSVRFCPSDTSLRTHVRARQNPRCPLSTLAVLCRKGFLIFTENQIPRIAHLWHMHPE